MATAKPVTSVRRSSGSRPDRGGEVPEVSRARWGGVALVIVSLMGAITLAVISPGDGTRTSGAGIVRPDVTPSPQATAEDTRRPTGQPEIASPRSGWVIGEWYIDVRVEVPEEPLPRRTLTLVVLRDGREVKSLPRPEIGATSTVTDVPLVAGANVLTAALRGPGGLGPESEPIAVTQDRDAPVLDVTTPKDGLETTESEIGVAGTSEAGASVKVENLAKGWDATLVVGPSGSFELVVPLALGKNRIVARSTDGAGMERRDDVVVERKDGRPVIKLTAPNRVSRADLPKEVRVVVDVTDVDGKAIEGANVSYGIGGPGGTTEDFSDETNAEGRSTWQVDVVAGSSQSSAIVSVEVIAPNGERSQEFQEIEIS
jgi:hypothetical protein